LKRWAKGYIIKSQDKIRRGRLNDVLYVLYYICFICIPGQAYGTAAVYVTQHLVILLGMHKTGSKAAPFFHNQKGNIINSVIEMQIL